MLHAGMILNKHKRLIILGASSHGKDCLDIALKMGLWNEIAFLDDDVTKTQALGFRIIGNVDHASDFLPNSDFFVALGNVSLRELLTQKLDLIRANIVSLIHPSASIALNVDIDRGSCFFANSVVNNSASIARGCIVNIAACVAHDAIIHPFVHLSPGSVIGGNVSIGSKAWIGMGAKVISNVSICDETRIAAGTYVLKDIAATGVYHGLHAQFTLNHDVSFF